MFGEDPIDETSMLTEDFKMLLEQDNPYLQTQNFSGVWAIARETD